MNLRQTTANKIVALVVLVITMLVWTLLDALQRNEDVDRIAVGESTDLAGLEVRVTHVELGGRLTDEFGSTQECTGCAYVVVMLELENPTRKPVPVDARIEYGDISVTPRSRPNESMGWCTTNSVVAPVNAATARDVTLRITPVEIVQGIQPEIVVDLAIDGITDVDLQRSVTAGAPEQEVLR